MAKKVVVVRLPKVILNDRFLSGLKKLKIKQKAGGNNHIKFKNGGRSCSIPPKHGKTINRNVVAKSLKDAGITVAEFMAVY